MDTIQLPFYPIENGSTVELKVKLLKHAFVTRSMFAGTIKGISPFSLPLPKDSLLRKKYNKIYYLSFIKNGLQTINCEDLYFIFNLWGTGYHHFLTEVAIKFPLFEKELRKGQILMPPNCPQFVFDFLKIADFENLCFMKRNCYVEKLHVITNTISGYYNGEHLLKLKEFVYERVDFTKNNDFDKIYVSRKDARSRKVLNEPELVEGLQKKGYRYLELERMPLAEQVNIFRNCRTLLSIHGAALTNGLFMPTGSQIFELYPKDTVESNFNRCYSRFSQALGHNHKYLFCERENPDKKFTLATDNICVDVDALLKVVT